MLAANLKWLFDEWPLVERFAAAAAAGFHAVELSLPYELSIAHLKVLLERHDQRFVYLLAAPGNWDGGERGLGAIPGREAEFRAGVRAAIAYARALGKPLIHVAAGRRPAGADIDACAAVLLANLRWASAEAARDDLRLVIEPVCRQDYPDYMLNTVAEALALIESVGAANLGIVLDVHHVQREAGSLDAAPLHAALAAALPRLWHVQLAFAPDRRGPEAASFDIHATLAHARGIGYRGVFSCEYRPGSGGTLASLGWAERYGIRAEAMPSSSQEIA